MRRLCYHLTAAGALCAGAANAQVAPLRYDAVSTPMPVDSSTSQDVAFRADSYDRITVKVMVAGKGPFNFLVDTGADHTVIARHLVSSLKLARAPSVQLFSVSGDEMVNTASLGTLKFSKKTIRNVNAAVLERSNLGADGVLGIDSLRSERVTFDFRKGVMTIVPSTTVESRVPNRDTVVVVGKLKAGRLVLTEARAASRPVNIVIDTGSDATVGNAALRRRLVGSKLLHPIGPITLQSVTGKTVVGELMMLDRLEVGGVTINQLNIVFADVPIFGVLKLEDRPAILLGMNAIRAFERVSIDFANKKFRVVLPQSGSNMQVVLAAR